MEQKITFIEGLPCAGKSLLTKELERNGNHVVHELGRTIPRDSFPGDGSSVDEIEKINEWFIDKESTRLSSNLNGYFDRSFFTHLVYAYAYEKFSGIKSFHKTVDRYRDALDSGRLILPDEVVYIDEEVKTSIERQLFKISIGRVALASFWRDETFLKNTVRGYESLLENLKGIDIITLDAEMSTEEKMNSLGRSEQRRLLAKRAIDLSRFKNTR